MHDTVLELYNKLLDKYFDEYYDLEKETKEELSFKFKPIKLKIRRYDYDKLYNEISDEDYDDYDDYEEEEYIDLPDMPPLERDEEEAKEGKRFEILMPKKLLTRLPILLA